MRSAITLAKRCCPSRCAAHPAALTEHDQSSIKKKDRYASRDIVTFVLCLSALLTGELASADKLSFTVTDSIALTRLTDPDPTLEPFKELNFKFSPDRSKFVIVTRKGNLTTGLNEYFLVMFSMQDVRAFLRSPNRLELPKQRLLVTLKTSSDKHAIDHVTWLSDGSGIAFVGREDDGPGQVYTFDLHSRAVRQLTHHSADVAAFALDSERGILVYAAASDPDWTARNRHGYAVTSEHLAMLTKKSPDEASPEVRYFVAHFAADKVLSVVADASLVPRDISVSPTGRWAVTLMQVHKIPIHWSKYEFIEGYLTRAAQPDPPAVPNGTARPQSGYIEDEVFGRPAPWLNRFELIDLETGVARPLLDAPAITAGWVEKALWSRDGSRVLLATTFLPLNIDDLAEQERRRRSPVIAEVELATGEATTVARLEERSAETGRTLFLTDVDWQADGSIVVHQREYGGAKLPANRYRKRGGRWVVGTGSSTPVREQLTSAHEAVDVQVSQDMNTPPNVLATNRRTGESRLITDLNPQLRERTLGRVEVFRWKDRLGRLFTGGLVLPPGYKPGARHPAVLQTYGFRMNEFLVDGPNGMQSAYAARAIANKGILVLQMPEFGTEPKDTNSTGKAEVGRWENSAENPRFVAMLEGAIDALDVRGLIDRSRIGLIGFSREGMHVHYALTFSNYPIAAATIADSAAATPWSYVSFYGYPYPGMLEWEDANLIGAPFWGEGIELWMKRSPAFNLARIRTPLRYEEFGTAFPPLCWDTFVNLKRHRRPVELIHIPLASHLLQTPYARYTSQQGNVDWFAFWLKGEEDPDSVKAEQYRRWRKLRAQQEALIEKRILESK